MPTFLILKGSSVKETVRGADPTALRTAVLFAAADAAKGSAGGSGIGFTGKGQSLGSTGAPPPRAANGSSGFAMPNLGAMTGSPGGYSQGSGLPQTIVRFVGLYLQTLFSFEPLQAAEGSPFRVQKSAGVGGRVRTVR